STDGFNSARGKVMTAATKSSRSGPTTDTRRRTEPGGLWPPAQIATKGPVPGMKNPTRLVTRAGDRPGNRRLADRLRAGTRFDRSRGKELFLYLQLTSKVAISSSLS